MGPSLLQRSFARKALKGFHISEEKPIKTPFAPHFQLSSEDCPKREDEKNFMARVPQASCIETLMFAMVCTRLDVAHMMGF